MTSQPKQRRKKALEPLDWRELAKGPALRGLTEILTTPPELARERASKRAEVDAQPTLQGMGVSPTVGVSPEDENTSIRADALGDGFPALTNQSPFVPHVINPSVIDPYRTEGPTYSHQAPAAAVETPTVVETVQSGRNFDGDSSREVTASRVEGDGTDRPTAGERPTDDGTYPIGLVSNKATEGDSPSDKQSSAAVAVELNYSVIAPSRSNSTGVSASVGGSTSEGFTSTEGVSPSEELMPTVGASLRPQQSPALRQPDQLDPRTRGSSVPTHYRPTGVAPTVGVAHAQRYNWWVDSAGTRYESKRVLRVVIAQHSMSLGEERVYQTLWHGRESDGILTETRKSKTFSLGYDRISRLVRLNEKSVRVLLPKLINKKILEVVAAENSASRLGRTYRIFNYEEILERQRVANLRNVVKNGRAVEFVWPEDTASVGESPILPGVAAPISSVANCGPKGGATTEGDKPTVGPTKTAHNQSLPAKPNPTGRSGIPGGEYPADLAPKVQAIVSSFDDDAVRTLWVKCVEQASDCTSEEVEYCLRLKAQQLLVRGKSVTNPVGLMLWAVPKCFEGTAALHVAFREQKRAEQEARRRADEQFRIQIEEYRRLAADPKTNAEDRVFYEQLLRDVE